ncbi:MAG TPA: DcaP family trimeric outer membrane transporter [Casimicrobiaceae bacterium]
MASCGSSRARAQVAAIAVGLAGIASAARADTLDELKAQIEALQKQVVELQRKQAASERKPALPDNVVTGGATKGSFKLPGSNTSVALGGYVKLDAVFSNPSVGVDNAGDLSLNPATIAVGPGAGDHEHNQVKFGARESRLFVKTNTPTAFGDLNTHVEFDFYGNDGNESVSNSHGLRLRHAYGTLGHFLAGQTWTNFMNPDALPETVDFGGPVGQIFDRQAQVRWTQSFGPGAWGSGGQWAIGLENPETVAQVPGGASFRADDDHVPDLTGQVRFDTARGKFSVHGLVRQLRVDSGAAPTATDAKVGGALSIAAIVPTIGKDDLRFTASAGNGIGRYSNGFFPDAIVGSDGRLRLPEQWGWFAAYRHYWTDSLRSSLVLSMAGENNPEGAPANTEKATRSMHVNLIWSPVANSDFGLEYIYASRETEDGLAGHLNRLQASAKYSF